jgi:diguanylate cyclase (GGDEF)-like protein
MRILIVDDDEYGREIVEAILVSAGYKDVVAAASAEEAYGCLGIARPATHDAPGIDLVLLDVIMPEIDGIEACARIRSEPRYSGLPIIMVTSLADADNLANAFVAGATDYINKPVSRVELLARVRSALRLKAEFDRREARELELLEVMARTRDDRPSKWIDDATGLFRGALAEAYLIAHADLCPASDTAVIAITIDRLDAYRATQGDAVADGIIAQVALAIGASAATVGAIAGKYDDGMMVLIAPGMKARSASELGESLRAAISSLTIRNRESVVADHVTVSISVVTGKIRHGKDCVHLLTRAVSAVKQQAKAGSNRVMREMA